MNNSNVSSDQGKILELRIEDLLLLHREVKQKKVGRYAVKYKRGERTAPVKVDYCVHTNKYNLCDGHHRVVAAHFLGRNSILAEVDPCFIHSCTGVDPKCEPFYNIRHIVLK